MCLRFPSIRTPDRIGPPRAILRETAVKVPIVKLPLPDARVSLEAAELCVESAEVCGLRPEPVELVAGEPPPIASLAHDLRSPLAAVLGFARLAREELASGDVGRAGLLIQRIERSARTLESILQSVLEPASAPHAADLPRVIEQIRSERKFELERRAIRLLAPENAPALAVRSADLYRLLSNLIGNAIDHMGAPANATIAVSLALEAEHATLRVCDNGVGIATMRRALEFDPAHSRCGEDASGGHRGLGLAIVRQLAASWSGRAWIDEATRTGAALCVTIPVAQ